MQAQDLTTLTAVASGLLLIAAAYQAQRAADEAAGDDAAPSWADEVDATLSGLVTVSPASDMTPSLQLIQHLKAREACKLTRYRLGDGGWTIGYGRFYPDGGPVPPERITQATADAWFLQDLEQRGARWVRAYVTRELAQNEFDGLCSMAFNLSPASFRKIAAEVNAGNDPDAVALRYVRAGTNLERGLRNRRAGELAMYHNGVYA